MRNYLDSKYGMSIAVEGDLMKVLFSQLNLIKQKSINVKSVQEEFNIIKSSLEAICSFLI